MADLTTTNVLLGIMAVVSVIEGIALVASMIVGMRMYRDLRGQLDTLESRHLTPITTRVLPLLDRAAPAVDDAKTMMQSVQRMSEKVEQSLSRVDEAVQGTMSSAEHAVDRVQVGVRRTTGTVVGVVRGVRTAIETFLTDQPGQPNGTGTHPPR